MIAVYYNGITLRKKLYRKSCHSVCAVPQSQISRNRYVQKCGRARKPDTAHLAMPILMSLCPNRIDFDEIDFGKRYLPMTMTV